MRSELTDRQQQVIDFIGRAKALNGYPPTRAEIAEHFGWKSPNAAECHLRALRLKGAIDIDHGKARGIVLL